MKNLHYLKKFVVMALAAMMTLSTFALPSLAEADSKVSISGVDKKATVTLYQVVKEDNGKWVHVKNDKQGVDITNTENNGVTNQVITPNADKASAIAANHDGLPSYGTTYNEKTDAFESATTGTNKPAPGVYIAVVTGATDGYVYNPMVVSIDYEQSTTEESSEVSAEQPFKGSAVAKKSKPSVNKTTEENNENFASNTFEPNNFGDENDEKTQNAGTDKAGEVVKYKVVTTIPSYGKVFTNPKFFFKDALQTGFVGYDSTALTIEELGKTEPLTLGDDYWFVDADGNKLDDFTLKGATSFRIQFAVTTGEAQRTICIKYNAKLVDKDHDDHLAGLDPYTNKAEIEWTTKHEDEDDYDKADDETHHYTFDIDGKIGGGKTGKEIIKVGTSDDGSYVYNEVEAEGMTYEPKKDAVFGIYKVSNPEADPADWTKGEEVQRATTAKDGTMNFKGLDAGKYVIVEITAPDGYALNETPVPVNIVPTFDAKGKMTEYTITINGKYQNTYAWDAGTVVKTHNSGDEDDVDNTALLMDRTVGTLPSTGGMGTVLFTVGGIAIMALALFLLFGGKKKQHQK